MTSLALTRKFQTDCKIIFLAEIEVGIRLGSELQFGDDVGRALGPPFMACCLSFNRLCISFTFLHWIVTTKNVVCHLIPQE